MKALPVVALAAALLSGFAHAADPASHQLSEFHLGTLITGPDVKLEDAKGKAVLIDEWGIHCGPCLAALPEVEKMAKRYKDRMVVFGAHAQDGTDDEVKAVVQKFRLSYTITKGANGPIPVSGIPHVFVFDPTGKLLFSGHPADKEFEKAVHHATSGASASSSTAGGAFPAHPSPDAFPGHTAQ